MRVILDANIFISAAISSGPPLRALSTCIERADIDLVVCPTLWREVGHSLLTKPRLLMRIPPEETCESMRRIRHLFCFVPDPVVVEEFTKDRKDDYLIALAREQGVPIIGAGTTICLIGPSRDHQSCAPLRSSRPLIQTLQLGRTGPSELLHRVHCPPLIASTQAPSRRGALPSALGRMAGGVLPLHDVETFG